MQRRVIIRAGIYSRRTSGRQRHRVPAGNRNPEAGRRTVPQLGNIRIDVSLVRTVSPWNNANGNRGAGIPLARVGRGAGIGEVALNALDHERRIRPRLERNAAIRHPAELDKAEREARRNRMHIAPDDAVHRQLQRGNRIFPASGKPNRDVCAERSQRKLARGRYREQAGARASLTDAAPGELALATHSVQGNGRGQSDLNRPRRESATGHQGALAELDDRLRKLRLSKYVTVNCPAAFRLSGLAVQQRRKPDKEWPAKFTV